MQSVGFEPTQLSLEDLKPSALNHSATIACEIFDKNLWKTDNDRVWTCDRVINSHVLYRLSYIVRSQTLYNHKLWLF